MLPPLATSGIGSLPHTQLELALQQALLVDIPAAPQLPRRDAAEYMVPQALEGLHGLRADAEGNAELDVGDWRRGAATLDARLDRALEHDEGVQRFLPSAAAWHALRPFLWEVEQRKLPFAKVQIAGPFTLRWVLRTTRGEPLAAIEEGKAVERQIFRLVLARSLALVRRLREAGTKPVIFIDEPGLYAFDRRDPQHLVSVQELRVVVLALRREGAVVGVHCCGNTEWAPLLALGWDVVSIDARLSLESVLATGAAFERFLAAGGILSLGIVPTDVSAPSDVDAVLGEARARLSPTALSRSLLTPACGLAMRTVPDAERIFEELRRAQHELRAQHRAA
jgi:Cobalamin-independent synthase, Catalytic domain